ncbi:hypothetical protein [Pontibacter sp. G13]|uniref:hypothetical protein n=1 Tax=Pontibacter sp. G13 TaxID=3074898 RepID=UPI00288AE6C1|nr:hypothetical protein [Pontibacter sp. G13]WNJ16039.1 hypothetical protein RJD25_14345 [Pontibacter sp. G13]
MPDFSALNRTFCLLTLLLACAYQVQAQSSIKDSTIQIHVLDVSYHGMIPAGNFADRFGYTSLMGLEYSFKLRSNWYVGAGVQILFSESFKDEDFLENLMIAEDFVIADNGNLAEVRIGATGYVVPFFVGKIFPLNPNHNPNSGLMIELGGQFIQHKIGIATPQETTTPITGEYAKGYDKLSRGFGASQAIGYRFFSNNGRVNFAAGFKFSQNFTYNQRPINFQTGQVEHDLQKDFLSGFFFRWSFPIYTKAPNQSYLY